jgi:hypothetical protein
LQGVEPAFPSASRAARYPDATTAVVFSAEFSSRRRGALAEGFANVWQNSSHIADPGPCANATTLGRCRPECERFLFYPVDYRLFGS